MQDIIDMWIDKDGYLFFETYFDEQDADKLKTFIEKELGYKVVLQRDNEREFKPYPAIWKKNVVRDIDWSNYHNVLYIIKNRDKSDEDIVRGLLSEGSGFSITIKRGIVMTEYAKFLEAEGRVPSEEKLKEFSKNLAKRFMKAKRLQAGTQITYLYDGMKFKGKVVAYNDGAYDIQLENGKELTCQRNEIELDFD